MAETMKLKFANTAPGPRGVNGIAGLVMIEPGEVAVVELTEAEAASAEDAGYFEIGDAPDDAEGDGAPASLKGLNKTQLLEIAAAEGVTEAEKDGAMVPVAEATNANITKAIETKRAAA